MAKVLLIIPPLDECTHPYPAVPQLTAWLRREGVTVDAVDLNIAFFRWLFEKKRLEESAEIAWELLKRLDGKHSLEGGEREMYFTLADAFALLEDSNFRAGETPEELAVRMPRGAAVRIARAVLALSFARSFPGHFIITKGAIPACSWLMDCMESGYIRGILKKPGRTLFDEFYEDCLSGLDLAQYDLAGISIPFFSSADPAMRLVRTIRKAAPEIHITLGGNYVSLNLSKTNDPAFFDHFDSLVVGDGEIPLRELCARLPRRGDPREVPGLIWRENGSIQRNVPSRGIPLDELPVPVDAFDPVDYPFMDISEQVRMRLTKGCSWAKCAFCGIPGCGLVPFERPDEERMFEKVRGCVERGKTDFVFYDEEAGADMLERFARRVLGAALNFRWSINLRFDSRIDLRWANLMAQAGCRDLLVGLENYNDRILNLMNKGTNVVLIDRCLEEISWSGIRVTAYMMTGLPTETESEARDSFARIVSRLEDGNISHAWYTKYFISEKSPVQLAPAKYGIIGYFMPPERDLAVHSDDFEHDGMSATIRQSLHDEFTKTLNKRFYGIQSVRDASRRVSWSGQILEASSK